VKAEFGVYGGSGFYSLIKDAEEIRVDTPYGAPSDALTLGEIAGRTVAFLPRHAKNHSIPPHKINYRANAWAFKSLGIKRVIGPCAAGSLQKEVPPGTFVVCDQIVDFTKGRDYTLFDGPEVKHLVSGDPYCPELRAAAVQAGHKLGLSIREKGTVVVIEGPRFSTRAESRFYSAQGWEVINMTQSPEAFLCAEAGMCYANISLITDYDAGFEGMAPVSHEEVLRVFVANNEKLKSLVVEMIKAAPEKQACACAKRI